MAFWKKSCCKENLEMFALLVEPKATYRCLSLLKKRTRRTKRNLNYIFPLFKCKCVTRWGSLSLNLLLSPTTQFWEKRKKSGSCRDNTILHSWCLSQPELDFCVKGVSRQLRGKNRHLAADFNCSQTWSRSKNYPISVENEICVCLSQVWRRIEFWCDTVQAVLN